MEPRAVPILDEAECAKIRDSVHRLRRFWTSRHPEIPSYTLGAAAYLDIGDQGHAKYMTTSTRTRRLLLREFDWLYERLEATLTEQLGTTTKLTDRHAPPGFHIFEWHERLVELVPKLHFDLQHEDLDWAEDPSTDPARRITFTIPIEVPPAGAGLYIWPILREETFNKTAEELQTLHAETASTYHAYVPGQLLLHDGNRLHQIAADRPMYAGEARMTFQGHGVLTQGLWQLYW